MNSWAACGVGTVGAAVGDAYRVTATEPTLGRPGLRAIIEQPLEPGRGYTASVEVGYSDGARGTKRLVAYWLHTGYGEGAFGDGPFGGVTPFAVLDRLAMPDLGATSVYEVAGVVPDEGAVGLALMVTDAGPDTPWPVGAWLEASSVVVEPEKVTLQAFATMDPVPRVRVTLRDLDELGAAFVTVYAENGRPVRGGWQLPAASLLIVDDFLAPFGRPVTYQVQLLDEDLAPLSIIQRTAPPVRAAGTVVQHVLDPFRAARARYLWGSEDDLGWDHDGDLVRPGGSRLPTWVGGGRWPLQGVPIKLGTDTAQQEADMRRVLGVDEPVDDLPILAFRTSHPTRLPQPFVAVVPSPRIVGLDWQAGGHVTHWHLTASQVREPGPALARGALTWADLMATRATWDAIRAAYPTWAAAMTDFSNAGASNA